MGVEFRRLRDDEVDEACGILTAAAEWLMSRGIRQWTEAFPRHLYQQYQERGENFALVRDARLVAIATLTPAAPPEWSEELRDRPIWWISKLAVAPDCHGQRLGRRMVEEVLKHLRQLDAMDAWLDCVQGPLRSFYESLGFLRVESKVVDFTTGPLHLVLMTRRLA